MKRVILIATALSCSMLLSGCLSVPLFSLGGIGAKKKDKDDMPQTAVEYSPSPGAIYRDGSPGQLNLFADRRARNVGDLLTITLNETFDAQTKATTTTSKSSTVDMAAPTLGGKERDKLANTVDASRDFSGTGDSSQSNSLTGSLTVTVIRRLPNGNLVVRGQKNLRLNQGNEYIQVDGVVREADIAADNTIPSGLVADARISYNGRGTIAQTNEMGVLARFFHSPLYPY